MAVRKYTQTDYSACRYLYENGNSGAVTATAGLTVAIVDRLALINLINGAVGTFSVGDIVRLSGLGVKTGAEAVRLGIAAATPTVAVVQQSTDPVTQKVY